MISIELKISQNVAALSEVAETYVPASGKKIKVRFFSGNGRSQKNVSAQLIWKYNQAGETVIWGIPDTQPMPFIHDVPDAEINGTNQLAIVCVNNEATEQFLSAYVHIEET
jgi:hypothetical protein